MVELHLSIIQGLARLETRRERDEAIEGILNLLEDIVDGKLPTKEEDSLARCGVNPFEGQILRADQILPVVEERAN